MSDAAADVAQVLASTDPLRDPAARAALERIVDAADAEDPVRSGVGIKALFAGLIEALNDGFDPADRARSNALMALAIERVAERDQALAAALTAAACPTAEDLLARQSACLARDPAWTGAAPRRIAILSRVTIGADVLLTSQILEVCRARWPAAELHLLGDPKLHGLFGGLPGLQVQAIGYPRRGRLRDRFAVGLAAGARLDEIGADLVIGPDSRIDQLGLLPLGSAPERYRLWANTQPDPARPRPLAELLREWLAQLCGSAATTGLAPRLRFDPTTERLHARLTAALGDRLLAIKLDHGGNPAKALPRTSEVAILRDAQRRGWRILIDRGFGEAEHAASDELMTALGWHPLDISESDEAGMGRKAADLAPGELAAAAVVRFHGSIAGWAAALAGCAAAFSYDSVGHHLAAAAGVPVVIAFTGYRNPAFVTAWTPSGTAPVEVVAIEHEDREEPASVDRVLAALPQPPGTGRATP